MSLNEMGKDAYCCSVVNLKDKFFVNHAEIKEKFKLIFIDADKGNYKKYYEKSLSLLDTNGLIIIDNVLWYGEVTTENSQDKITKTIKDFNKYVSNDNRVDKIIIPLGDGMTICRKL